ncbi:DUF6194 family protein [Microbacterium sp. SA39]|uniref:DUF6194 family protein n=1 Tax=Microbacterium sp. SA39 TaxID=1263625 RepID=UPI0005FA05F1|nr:DUF6194 family protein [Microbacterium sp. SA39]KJQ52813.1 hypothetical protein RS85_03707 [Microbacterium sp. SA39]
MDMTQIIETADTDSREADVFHRHPLYGDAGWVCVIEPAEKTTDAALALLREAHEAARKRAARRAETAQ